MGFHVAELGNQTQSCTLYGSLWFQFQKNLALPRSTFCWHFFFFGRSAIFRIWIPLVGLVRSRVYNRRTRCKSHIFSSSNSEVTHCGSPHSDVDHLIEHLPPGSRNFAMHARSDRFFDGLLSCDITLTWFPLWIYDLINSGALIWDLSPMWSITYTLQ